MSLWDDKKNIEMLKQLWAEGLTASQIAHRMPGTTRSGICGKANRLGLPARGPRAGKGPVRLRKPPLRSDGRPPSPKFSTEDISAFIRPASEDVADGGLQERRKNQCCFPIGDVGRPGFGYCRNDRELGDYCTSHFIRMRPGAAVKLRNSKVEERAKEAEPA